MGTAALKFLYLLASRPLPAPLEILYRSSIFSPELFRGLLLCRP